MTIKNRKEIKGIKLKGTHFQLTDQNTAKRYTISFGPERPCPEVTIHIGEKRLLCINHIKIPCTEKGAKRALNLALAIEKINNL